MRRRSRTYTAWVGAAGAIGVVFGIGGAVRLRRRISFSGKTVLITGGSRGLGLVLAGQFAREGADVAICARDEEELSRARSELAQYGVDVLGVQCDVTIPEQVTGMIEGLTRHFGRIDVLVNNAGTISVGPMETMTIADYQEAMKTHFWAPLYTTLSVLPQMKRREAGRIVNISSIGGKIAAPHLLPYSASKFALVGFSEGLRSEHDGNVRDVKSEDVNEYLREITGQDFTAKDFRTWAGTVLAAEALQEFEQVDSQAGRKRNVVRAIESVAKRLGNTKAVCRKCYIHPQIIESYMDGSLIEHLQAEAEKMLKPLKNLHPEEAAVLVLLSRRLASQKNRKRRMTSPCPSGRGG